MFLKVVFKFLAVVFERKTSIIPVGIISRPSTQSYVGVKSKSQDTYLIVTRILYGDRWELMTHMVWLRLVRVDATLRIALQFYWFVDIYTA